MDKRTRAYKIYEAGLDGSDSTLFSGCEENMLQAIATMIDYATKKAPPKKVDYSKLLYTEDDIIGVLNYDLPKSQKNTLNKQLLRMKLLHDDLDKFGAWFQHSMYPWMKKNDVQFTFSMLSRKFPAWLERARHYSGSGYETVTTEAWR